MTRSLLVVVALCGLAAAEPRPMVLDHPAVVAKSNDPLASPYIFVNRCVGGCTIRGAGIDDAAARTSTLPCSGGPNCSGGACSCQSSGTGTFTIGEFQSSTGQTGAAADAEWAAIMLCLKEVYSPYAVEVSDVRPSAVLYDEEVIAGHARDIGWLDSQVGGIAPGPGPGCAPENNIMSFTFANEIASSNRPQVLCAIAAQESAHAYGADHEFEFVADKSSACTDPMSYRGDCGGQRFYRNQPAACGEFAPRQCKCGGTQNSHALILKVFGPQTPITRPPHVELVLPTPGAIVGAGAIVQATAGAQRGIARLELWLNNYKWAEVKGAQFGATGQLDPSSYALSFPPGVPDSVIDIVVKAYDDINIETDSATLTVTKGAPCATAATCATGQLCDAGKCYWAPPTGQLGDACTFPQFCTSGVCSGTADKQICTQACLVGVTDSCPLGYDCLPTDSVNGVCFPAGAANAGCCSAAGSGWIHGGLSIVVVGLVMRRRRRA